MLWQMPELRHVHIATTLVRDRELACRLGDMESQHAQRARAAHSRRRCKPKCHSGRRSPPPTRPTRPRARGKHHAAAFAGKSEADAEPDARSTAAAAVVGECFHDEKAGWASRRWFPDMGKMPRARRLLCGILVCGRKYLPREPRARSATTSTAPGATTNLAGGERVRSG